MSKRVDTLDIEAAAFAPSSAHTSAADPSAKPESSSPSASRSKRQASGSAAATPAMSGPSGGVPASLGAEEPTMASSLPTGPPPAKKSRTNTPWTPAEEQRLRAMREAGNSWADIAKDMHYAEFAEDESQALLNAIKEYDANKWKAIGTKLGKPAKACEQYAKEHFAGRM